MFATDSPDHSDGTALRNPPPVVAYAVPWSIDRNGRTAVAVNTSAEDLTGVIVTLASTGELLVPHAVRVRPTEHVMFQLPPDEPIAVAVAILSWRRANDAEYLYRIAF
jgi:hypothetical protein